MRQQAAVGQQQADAAVLHHVGQAILGELRVQRHVGTTGLEDRQQPDHHLQPAIHRDAHRHFRTDTHRPQLAGQAIGLAIQLAVRQRLVAEDQGDGLRCALCLGLDQDMHAVFARIDPLGTTPAAEDQSLFLVAQQRQVGNGLVHALAGNRPQQVAPVTGQALNGPRFEQRGGVGQCRPQAVLTLEGIQRQVELSGRAAGIDRLDLHPRQRTHRPLEFGLVVVHHLEQRAVAQAAFRLQGLHQMLERQVLMGLCPQHRLPDLLQQLAEGGP